jgi:hypothetical protein
LADPVSVCPFVAVADAKVQLVQVAAIAPDAKLSTTIPQINHFKKPFLMFLVVLL